MLSLFPLNDTLAWCCGSALGGSSSLAPHLTPSRKVSNVARRTLQHHPHIAMPSFPQLNPLRLRSYILRLPLCTRLLLVVCVALWAAAIPFPWLRDWASLEPDKMDFTQSRSFSFVWEGIGTVGREKMERVQAAGVLPCDAGGAAWGPRRSLAWKDL